MTGPRTPRAVLCAAVLGFLSFAAQVEPGESPAGAASVTVTVRAVRNARGKVGVAMFDSADGFPEDHAKARRRAWTGIADGVAVARFDGVPFGRYAFAAFHDENADGELDKNLFGIPQEGYGVSNRAQRKGGRPRFDPAVVTIDTEKVALEIVLGY